MHILIDKTNMAVVYRCQRVETLRTLAELHLPNIATSILEETSWGAFGAMVVRDLQRLFENLTDGVNPHSANPAYLIGQIMRLCQSAPETYVVMHAKGETPKPLLGSWTTAQGLPIPTPAALPPPPPQAPSWAVAPATTPPKYAPPWAK